MKLLQSKVPPIVAFLAAAIMWGIAKEGPAIDIGACDPRQRKDELFFADKFEPTVKAIRADVAVTIIPGLNHIDMITGPGAVPTIIATVRGRTRT